MAEISIQKGALEKIDRRPLHIRAAEQNLQHGYTLVIDEQGGYAFWKHLSKSLLHQDFRRVAEIVETFGVEYSGQFRKTKNTLTEGLPATPRPAPNPEPITAPPPEPTPEPTTAEQPEESTMTTTAKPAEPEMLLIDEVVSRYSEFSSRNQISLAGRRGRLTIQKDGNRSYVVLDHDFFQYLAEVQARASGQHLPRTTVSRERNSGAEKPAAHLEEPKAAGPVHVEPQIVHEAAENVHETEQRVSEPPSTDTTAAASDDAEPITEDQPTGPVMLTIRPARRLSIEQLRAEVEARKAQASAAPSGDGEPAERPYRVTSLLNVWPVQDLFQEVAAEVKKYDPVEKLVNAAHALEMARDKGDTMQEILAEQTYEGAVRQAEEEIVTLHREQLRIKRALSKTRRRRLISRLVGL